MTFRTLIASLALLLLIGCAKNDREKTLAHIADLVSESPEVALAALDSITRTDLSNRDKHFYDFLTIKARDKAYIRHSSDSLILDLISFYHDSELYPEILYYAGRVYSDLGDYPTSLEYFQKALDKTPETTPEMIHLKGNILSQSARLLNKVRLYNQAIPYLKEALRIDSIERDTFNLTYDNQLLGAILLHQEDIANADMRFRQASHWAQALSESDRAHIQMYRAATKLARQDIDSAVLLIQGLPEMMRPLQKNLAYAYASDIYLSAGIIDSAYYYAGKLVHNIDKSNRKSGYRNLFSQNLYNHIPKDSIPIYIRAYASTLENYYDKHDDQQLLIQNAFYNYQIHQRERIRAEKQAHQLTYVIGVLALTILVCILIALFLRNRKKTLLITLQSTILELEDLKKSLTERNAHELEPVVQMKDSQRLSDLEILRKRLQVQLDNLKGMSPTHTYIHPDILNSVVLKKINKYILDNKAIPDRSVIWSELEQVVISTSPLFKDRLQLLVGQNLKPHDYHVVLLIRCGITPSQMVILLGRTKGTISYRRKHVCETVLGQKIDSQLIDDIIRYI